jgi:hypothetical protein
MVVDDDLLHYDCHDDLQRVSPGGTDSLLKVHACSVRVRCWRVQDFPKLW